MKNKIYKIYIDNSEFMELVSELATQITEKGFGEDTYGFSHEVGQEDVVMFTEKAQDYFNDKYDEIEMMFNTIANIYSDGKQ
jgi:hypothetical protein